MYWLRTRGGRTQPALAEDRAANERTLGSSICRVRLSPSDVIRPPGRGRGLPLVLSQRHGQHRRAGVDHGERSSTRSRRALDDLLARSCAPGRERRRGTTAAQRSGWGRIPRSVGPPVAPGGRGGNLGGPRRRDQRWRVARDGCLSGGDGGSRSPLSVTPNRGGGPGLRRGLAVPHLHRRGR